jgi:hypothetical protein
VDAIAPDATPRHDVGDGVRDGNHCVRAAILEARAEVPAQPEVNAPRNDDFRRSTQVRKPGEGGGVRGVRVHDLRAMSKDCPPQVARGEQVQLAPRHGANDIEAGIAGAPGKLIATARHDDRVMPTAAHSRREPEDLALATAPTPLRIDVQNRQQRSVLDLTSSAGIVDRCTS